MESKIFFQSEQKETTFFDIKVRNARLCPGGQRTTSTTVVSHGPLIFAAALMWAAGIQSSHKTKQWRSGASEQKTSKYSVLQGLPSWRFSVTESKSDRCVIMFIKVLLLFIGRKADDLPYHWKNEGPCGGHKVPVLNPEGAARGKLFYYKRYFKVWGGLLVFLTNDHCTSGAGERAKVLLWAIYLGIISGYSTLLWEIVRQGVSELIALMLSPAGQVGSDLNSEIGHLRQGACSQTWFSLLPTCLLVRPMRCSIKTEWITQQPAQHNIPSNIPCTTQRALLDVPWLPSILWRNGHMYFLSLTFLSCLGCVLISETNW